MKTLIFSIIFLFLVIYAIVKYIQEIRFFLILENRKFNLSFETLYILVMAFCTLFLGFFEWFLWKIGVLIDKFRKDNRKSGRGP